MTSIVKTSLVLVYCVLAFNRCVSNPLSDRNQPYAQGSGELEHHQIQRQENEGVPPPSNDNAPNNTQYEDDNSNVQQGLGLPRFRNGEIFSNRSLTIQIRSEGNLQENKTSEHIELSSEQNPDQAAQASSLERNTTADSSRNEHIIEHLNVLSIHRNNSDSFSHGEQASHRDQSSNVNLGPSGNQEERLSIVKRTVLPAHFPETQNRSLTTHSSVSSESGEISQSEIIHENDTNLQGNRENEIKVMANGTTIMANIITTTLSPETLNSNLLLPDTHPDSVNIIEPGVDTEGNVTENGQANETSLANKQDGTPLPTESVPLVTIRIPPSENQATEIPQPSNRGEENSNSINSTTSEPLPTKENKYLTKDGILEMTLPIKDPDQPEIATEHNTFPQISSTEPVTILPSSISEGYTTKKSTTHGLPEEVASTTVSSMKPTTQFTTRLPTEQNIVERTTFSTHPQEQLPTEKIFSVNSFSSSGIPYTSTTPSNEEVRETPTQFPPSERVPEVPIRYPTEQVNPELTEPIIRTSTRAVVVTEAGSGDGRTTFPDENVPHVTLRIPTEPMEITSTTFLPETTSINLNGKRSSAPYAEVTEKIAGKTDKGSHVLASESTTIGRNSTTLIPSTVTTKDISGPVQIITTTATTTSTTTTSTTTAAVFTTTTTAKIVQRSSYSTIQNTSPEIEIHNTTEPNMHLTTEPSKTKHPVVSSRLPSNNVASTTSNTPPTRATGINTSYYPTLTLNTTSQLLTHPTTQQLPSTSKLIERTNVTIEQNYPISKENNTVASISTTTSNYLTTPLDTSNKHEHTTRTQQNTSTAASRLTPSLVGTTTPSSIIPSSSVHNGTTRWPNSTSRSTTKKQRTNAPTTKKPTEIPHKPTEKPEDVATTTSIVPPAYISMQFQMTLNEFCSGRSTLTKVLTDIIKRKTDKTFNETQIKFINQLCYDERVFDYKNINDTKSAIVTVDIYMTDKKGQIDIQLTVDSSHVLRRGFLTSQSRYGQKLVNVHLITSYVNGNQKDYQETGLSSGMTIAVIIVIIGGVCCICLIVIQILMHKRNEKGSRNILPGPNRFSLRSLDSIALNAVPKSRPHSGFWNPGLDHSEENIPSIPTNPLGFNSLSNMTRDMVEIYKEYEKLPHETPNLSCVPIGAEDKNRFANVIPISHSRVKLKKLPHEEYSDYINANFLTGYNGDVHAYIATQAPLSNTIGDFWRMVWEQQSRVIIMLMAVNEASQPRDPAYVPDTEGVNGRVRYGDIVLVLKKKEVRQEYIMSLLEVKDIEHNLVREVRHFWFTSWPVDSIPEPISVIKLILDTRVHYEDSGAPVIVHCSSGTGRTGTLIAVDICMRSYESKRVVDILGCVSSMRKERAGVVQNKEQYALIYKTLNEYAVIMGSPRLAPSSSSAIQLQHML